MKLSKFISTSIFQITSVLFFIAFLFGALNIHFRDRNNYCEMTYMFEYPQFVRISVTQNNEFPQYGLYAYSEGRLTERTRKMWFDGIPVLFLPGNFGSHKQSRSLASVALRKAINNVHGHHFDYFTVDYNEELSALYGGVLERQTEFAAHCITKILSLYKNNKYVRTVPTSVILIGHSMGGLIAKRLLMYPKTINMTKLALTLAAPLDAPVINFDILINDYYLQLASEWRSSSEVLKSKLLLSFGNGARDVLMPSSLTGSDDSDLNALTTSVPGVWVSPDHVSIVWCKQLVMAINRFLYAIVDYKTQQIINDKQLLMSYANFYFEANRSMELNPSISRPNIAMIPDAFWYEDNRRIYQVSRPEITKTTYLMIRLVSFPQNRFVAVQSINVEDKEWLFGCSADDVYGSHRYCKIAKSLTELSRWTGAANNAGKRKLTTINLHKIMELYPKWTHVIVKVSPTKRPVTLNVDINDKASREITVDLPYTFSFGKTVIMKETEKNSLYYELILPGLELIHHAYYLYVEPTSSCMATQYHSSAELHVPWAKNHEYFHYFTQAKKSPMKIRLFKNNPNVTYNMDTNEYVRITLLLDPQCTYTISIAPSIYNQIGQLVRNYYHLLPAYTAAVILLAVRSNIIKLQKHGSCVSFHESLMDEGVKPYYVLVVAKLGMTVLMSTPILMYIFETANINHTELQYFLRSLLILPMFMTALGLVNIVAAIVLVSMVFSSQLAHRLLFRIVWRGRTNIAEKVASGLQKIPTVVSAALVCAVPLSCGAASLVAGAAFYSFMLSKMYEEYLEDYVYKLMAKIASKLCYFMKSNKHANDTKQNSKIEYTILKSEQAIVKTDIKPTDDAKTSFEAENKMLQQLEDKKEDVEGTEESQAFVATIKEDSKSSKETKEKCIESKTKSSSDIDEKLSGLNFHMMMFFLWVVVTLLNLTALLTWARNFKYNMILKPDTSYYPGFMMSICTGFVWQIETPRNNLKYYDLVSKILFVMSILILVLGPFGTYYINYIVSFAFLLITVQQLFDQEQNVESNIIKESPTPAEDKEKEANENANNSETNQSTKESKEKEASEDATNSERDHSAEESKEREETTSSSNCECNENRIYNVFKRFKDKFNFNEVDS